MNNYEIWLLVAGHLLGFSICLVAGAIYIAARSYYEAKQQSETFIAIEDLRDEQPFRFSPEEPIKVVCAWCPDQRVIGGDPNARITSHEICPECATKIYAKMNQSLEVL